MGADPVDFAGQNGVYLLHDNREVVYVGRTSERPLGRRLFEHTQDRLRGRWNRFSWFGVLQVTDDGRLVENSWQPDANAWISTMEAILIEGLEPRQNRRRGDDFTGIEYLQAEDPEMEREQMLSLLKEMGQRLT
ncbi:MAG: GIY-YIG nuclease family protein [Planctomycetaceae bacterium]